MLFTRILILDQQLVMALRQAHHPPSTPWITSPCAAVCVPVSITGAICSEHAGRHVTALKYHREAPGTCRAQVFSKMAICLQLKQAEGRRTSGRKLPFVISEGWDYLLLSVTGMMPHVERQQNIGFLEQFNYDFLFSWG